MRRRLCLAAALALLSGGAWSQESDPWSHANVGEFRMRHAELSLAVDFQSRQLQGQVALEFERLDPRATQLVLDTKDLTILDVTEQTTDIMGATEAIAPMWISRPFRLGKADPILGTPLIIELPPSKAQQLVLRIDYETGPKARGLRWVMPTPASPHQAPLLFTVSAPINARSWIPLQDTPQARATYRVHVRTDERLSVLLPGTMVAGKDRGEPQWFIMTHPVPPAALALVVGELRAKPLGARAEVHAEGSLASAAAKAFGDLQPLLQAGERLLGRYPWEHFNVVVMPPAFPVADMDYPGLSLVSPTLLGARAAGPARLAEALAQSWVASQLAAPQWRDRWLGPAIASYFAGRILATLPGGAPPPPSPAADAAGEGALPTDLQGSGYDDIFDAALRARGRLFEGLARRAGAARIDSALRGFLDQAAAQPPTADLLRSTLQRALVDGKSGSLSAAELEDAWSDPGRFAADAGPAPPALSPADPQAVLAQVRQSPLATLARLPDHTEPALLAQLDRELKLSADPDAAVASAWFELCLRAGYDPARVPLEHFLLTTGRLDLIEPLYEQLVASPSGSALAQRIFALARPGLDPFVVRRLEQIVHP